MDRRNFLQMGAAALLLGSLNYRAKADNSAYNPARLSINLTSNDIFITNEVYQKRMQRARSLMQNAKVDLLFSVPSRNLVYLTKLDTFRSERLIALLLPLANDATIITPSFEEERLRRSSIINSFAAWQESEDPYQLTNQYLQKWKVTRVAMEPSTDLATYWKLRAACPQVEFVDGTEIFTALRLQKSSEELSAIKRATEVTLKAINTSHQALLLGKTENEIIGIFSETLNKDDISGGGTVQFGDNAALPHGGPGARKLVKGSPVLMDVSCRIDGYYSDITRTIFWGGEHTPKFKEVYNTVWEAQQAGIATAKPGVECQAVDRAARAVIEKAGYGKYFTHRLGHGMGMDVHEPPYLVEGNKFQLQPGNVVTIEPGIYILNEFGVRIEDDFVITEKGAQPLSELCNRL